jgi:winged helix-turn helix protein
MPEFVRPLGSEEAQVIRQLTRSRTVPAGIFQRALIVLWSNEGLTPTEIANRLPMKWDNVVKWIRRFNQDGLAGLQERPGRGRKRSRTAEDALSVVETVLTPPS